MIVDIRWLERDRQDLPPEFNTFSPDAKETVLQIRVTDGTESFSDWIDVPLIEEEQ